MALIYRIDCKVTGLTYVGKTILSLEDRWRNHVDYASWVIRHRPEKDTYFARAIRKYGPDAFVPSVIEETDERLLNEREFCWIAELNTFERGYNSTRGGEGRLGYVCSDETREKIRQRALGRKHSIETLKKIAEKKRGVKQDPHVVEKRAATNRAANHKRSNEVKEKIRRANTGQKRSTETRARIADVGRGRVTSEETKKKLGRCVNQLTRDGQYIATFDTLTSAAVASGYSKGAVCNNIRDPERWPLKDLKFEYVAK